MIGDGLSHATFGGVGIGLVLGLTLENATWAALPFVLLVAVSIVALGKHAKLAGDAALAVFFSISMALGIATLHLAARTGRGVDIESVLFGSILGVQPQDLFWLGGIGGVILLVLWRQGPKMAYAGFYPELAAISGVRVIFQEYLLMILTAAVTVLAVKAVGVLLVSAWLVLPATIGRLTSARLGTMLFSAALSALLGSFLGLVCSYHLDIPGGAAMTLCLGIIFVLLLCFQQFKVIFIRT
jgi:zinc transport system permease protein